jgi:hypothetical protein
LLVASRHLVLLYPLTDTVHLLVSFFIPPPKSSLLSLPSQCQGPADKQFWGIGISLASAGTSFLTAYVHPDPQVRVLSLLSGVSSLLIGPITFGSGLPAINSEMLALGKQNLTEDEWTKRSSRVDELVQGWEKRHNLRFISYTGGWALSTAALITTLAQ